MTSALEQRARVHASLGEPHRLAIVDHLLTSDRTPSQLGRQLGLSSNLVTHHLDVLEEVGLIERFTSSGDRRRRYVRLVGQPFGLPGPADVVPADTTLFVCTHNSARSQLAAALWTDRTGRPAASAGTDPADAVHRGAVAAAARAGLDLGHARPTMLADGDAGRAGTVVTVCDRAYEELASPSHWWHWSTPDPVVAGTRRAFDAVIADLERRITALL